jgi:hypothetical protein
MGRFIVNLISLALVIIVNTLANILPLNGQSTSEISNRLLVLFTPAVYVFSIFGCHLHPPCDLGISHAAKGMKEQSP